LADYKKQSNKLSAHSKIQRMIAFELIH